MALGPGRPPLLKDTDAPGGWPHHCREKGRSRCLGGLSGEHSHIDVEGKVGPVWGWKATDNFLRHTGIFTGVHGSIRCSFFLHGRLGTVTSPRGLEKSSRLSLGVLAVVVSTAQMALAVRAAPCANVSLRSSQANHLHASCL